jgi:hypothetical protein
MTEIPLMPSQPNYRVRAPRVASPYSPPQQAETPILAPSAAYNPTPAINAQHQAQSKPNAYNTAAFESWYKQLSSEQRSRFAPGRRPDSSFRIVKADGSKFETSGPADDGVMEALTRDKARDHFISTLRFPDQPQKPPAHVPTPTIVPGQPSAVASGPSLLSSHPPWPSPAPRSPSRPPSLPRPLLSLAPPPRARPSPPPR